MLGEAITQARREGSLGVVGEVVDWPGFRRRLQGRISAWTRAERPVNGPPPDERPATADEWVIFRHYRRLLERADAVDADGLAAWASRQLGGRGRAPVGLRKLGAVALLDLSSVSRASWRALEFVNAKARTVDVSVSFSPDETLAEVFSCTKGLRERLLTLGFTEQSADPHEGLLTPTLYDLGLDVLRSDAHLRPKRQEAQGLGVTGAPRGEGTGLVVAERVRDLLQRGIAPEDILVLFPAWDDSAEVVLETLQAWGLPVAADAPSLLGIDPAVSALHLAATLGTAGWDASAVVRLLRHGLVRPRWPEAEAPLSRAAAAWALRATRVFRGIEPLRAGLARDASSDDGRRAARARTAQGVIEPLLQLVEDLNQPRRWDEQIERLRELAGTLGLDGARLSALWDALSDHGMALDAVGVAGRDWTWRAFSEELQSLAGELSVPAPAAPPGVVRLRTLSEADGACAEQILLVNLGEGTLPSRAAVDPDLSALDPEEDAPPPPANPALAREALRFLQVVTSAREGLEIVYPTSDEQGQPLLKAGFLEDLLDLFTPEARKRLDEQVTRIDPAYRERPELAGAPRDACVRAVALACDGEGNTLARLARDPKLRPSLQGTAAALQLAHERLRVRTFGPYDGRLADASAVAAIGHTFGPEKVLSPSQLESFIACPFQFFLRYVLRLETVDERDELDEDYTGRGSILHSILEELEQRLLYEPADRLDLSRALMHQRLERESTVVSEIDGGLLEIERHRLDQMLTRYARQHEKYEESGGSDVARPHKFEVVFGDDRRGDSHPSLVLGTGRDSVSLQGKIDRIDLVESEGGVGFRVIDYKTGSCPSPKDVAGALYVQLPLYALAVERLVLPEGPARLVDVGYWGLRREGYRRIVLKRWAEDRAAFEDYVLDLARLIRGGSFVVHSQREDCTKFCEFSAVCRIRQVRAVGKERDGFPTLAWLGEKAKSEPVDE